MTLDEGVKKYELSFMLKSDEAAESVSALLKNQGCEILERSQAQKMKLAYPIKKEVSALFLTVVVEILPEKISGLDHQLRLVPEILRFIIITPPVEKEDRSERPMRYSRGKPESPKRIDEPKDTPPSVPAEPEILTNELLEKKLEEILG